MKIGLWVKIPISFKKGKAVALVNCSVVVNYFCIFRFV